MATDNHELTGALLTQLGLIPGVKSIQRGPERMAVDFTDGMTATVVLSLIGKFFGRVEFDVYTPAENRSSVPHSVVPKLDPDGVVRLLSRLAQSASTR